ncbi:transposase, partial [Fictibacillus sp. NRS-1165]|uniref:transposase n=1 Tax=Fictibacillus sp. NRS-1165 TaxID=3144463 RepID=UPI003D1D6CCE
QNMYKHLDIHLSSLLPSQVIWKQEKQIYALPPTKAQNRITERQQRKWRLICGVQAAHRSGKTISRISRELSLDRKTVQKYLKTNHPPVDKRKKKSDRLEPYRQEVEERVKQGTTTRNLYEYLSSIGYEGTYSALRSRVENLRRNFKINGEYTKDYKISRKTIAHYVWKREENLGSKEQERLKACFLLHPELIEIHSIIQRYRQAIKEQNYSLLLVWLKERLTNRKNVFYSYAVRLRSDLQAIKQSFLLPYSNGVLEGQVNRLKTIKRMMYGRAGVLLLRKRMLYQL